MLKMDSLYELSEEMRKCTSCELWKGRTLVVTGEGPVGAKVMLIGEGPGADEDRTGRPFVGRAGKLLNGILEEVGLKREEIFIANCVKCRPPENRNPSVGEMKACKKWLDKQIEVVNPKLIVLLGRVALNNLLGEEKIKDFRGRVIERQGRKYIVTYHPSAGLRFPIKIKGKIKEDFEKIKELIQSSGKLTDGSREWTLSDYF